MPESQLDFHSSLYQGFLKAPFLTFIPLIRLSMPLARSPEPKGVTRHFSCGFRHFTLPPIWWPELIRKIAVFLTAYSTLSIIYTFLLRDPFSVLFSFKVS